MRSNFLEKKNRGTAQEAANRTSSAEAGRKSCYCYVFVRRKLKEKRKVFLEEGREHQLLYYEKSKKLI